MDTSPNTDSDNWSCSGPLTLHGHAGKEFMPGELRAVEVDNRAYLGKYAKDFKVLGVCTLFLDDEPSDYESMVLQRIERGAGEEKYAYTFSKVGLTEEARRTTVLNQVKNKVPQKKQKKRATGVAISGEDAPPSSVAGEAAAAGALRTSSAPSSAGTVGSKRKLSARGPEAMEEDEEEAEPLQSIEHGF